MDRMELFVSPTRWRTVSSLPSTVSHGGRKFRQVRHNTSIGLDRGGSRNDQEQLRISDAKFSLRQGGANRTPKACRSTSLENLVGSVGVNQIHWMQTN